MPRGSQWTVGENEMAIEPVFAWLGPPPWDQVPPTPQVAEWAKVLHEREPRHSASSWDAKIRDVLSCLPILTVKPTTAVRPARAQDQGRGERADGRGSVHKGTGGTSARRDVSAAWPGRLYGLRR